MRLRVFGSGSQGNALAVRSGGTLLLVDCGFSCRELEKRMSACGVRTDDVTAVLFTHDHTDHCKGVATFHKRHPQVPLYANGNTADAIATLTGVEDGWRVFETAEPFTIGEIEVTSFSIPHDAADPVGFVLDDGSARLGIATDLGFATGLVERRLLGCTALALEFNHDLRMLEGSGRPPSLIQRIRGRGGHLSNDQAAELLAAVAGSGLRHVVPMHLSGECNEPALAVAAARGALRAAGVDPGIVREPSFPTPVFEV